MMENGMKKDDQAVDEPNASEPEAREDPTSDVQGDTTENAEAEETVSDQDKLNQLNEKFLRTLADVENMRRRHERELEDARKFAATGFARDLLDVADNMRRALSSVPAEAKQDSELLSTLVTGVEMTERSLLTAFEKHKISRVEPEKGEKFNPNRHQAMFEIATDDLPPGAIAEVMQAGYVIADRLLRPAMVGVAKAQPKPVAPPEPAEAAEVGAKIDTTA